MIELDIYTDCSGNKKSKDFGYSAVFNYKGVEYFRSHIVTQEQLKELLSCEDEMSNPTVEVFALNEILGCFFIGLMQLAGKEVDLRLNIYSDYRGVSCWFNKEWAMNKSYIRKLIRLCREYSKRLKEHYGIEVTVHWVKGHSGISGNERADKLAGQRLNKSNIEEFFTIIKTKYLC